MPIKETIEWEYDIPDIDASQGSGYGATKVRISVPRKITQPDVDDLEARFALLITQLRRINNA